MERFENFESNSVSHRYWAPDFTHPSEVETLLLPILPTCGHGCGPADPVLPGGEATQGWVQEHLWEEEAAASKRSTCHKAHPTPHSEEVLSQAFISRISPWVLVLKLVSRPPSTHPKILWVVSNIKEKGRFLSSFTCIHLITWKLWQRGKNSKFGILLTF